MMRTQISLTTDERRILDREAARTGRSIAALIRDAVARTYGSEPDVDSDLLAIGSALGAWLDRDLDGEEFVESLRSGDRLSRAVAR